MKSTSFLNDGIISKTNKKELQKCFLTSKKVIGDNSYICIYHHL